MLAKSQIQALPHGHVIERPVHLVRVRVVKKMKYKDCDICGEDVEVIISTERRLKTESRVCIDCYMGKR